MEDSEKKLSELLNDKSFVRWITGRAAPREQKEWNLWEQQDSSNSRLKEQARKLYSLPMTSFEEADTQKQLKRLNTRIGNYKSWNGRGKKNFNSYKYRWVAAAAFLLIIAISSVIVLTTQNPSSGAKDVHTTLKVGYGESGILNVSDGSSILLNANSKLRYNPSGFDSDNVEVWLEGEAYFSIKNRSSSSERTFTVHTKDGDVQVLGTKFNVNTHQHTSVVLEKGKVQVTLGDSVQKEVLQPGQIAILDSTQDTIPIQNIDPALYTAWLDDKLKFDRTSLRQILQRIETTYGIKIAVSRSDLYQKKISGSLQNPDLKTLLEGLEKALNIEFEKHSDNKYMVTERDNYSRNN